MPAEDQPKSQRADDQCSPLRPQGPVGTFSPIAQAYLYTLLPCLLLESCPPSWHVHIPPVLRPGSNTLPSMKPLLHKRYLISPLCTPITLQPLLTFTSVPYNIGSLSLSQLSHHAGWRVRTHPSQARRPRYPDPVLEKCTGWASSRNTASSSSSRRRYRASHSTASRVWGERHTLSEKHWVGSGRWGHQRQETVRGVHEVESGPSTAQTSSCAPKGTC